MKTEREIRARIEECERDLSELKARRKELDFALYIERESLIQKELATLKWVLSES